MTPDTSGPAWRVPLAYYDPEECCWRTSGVMFPSDWPTSSQTCPAWGMTRRGELFELPTPALPTAEPASSSLLPTPNRGDAQQRHQTLEQHYEREAVKKAANPNLGGLHLTLVTVAENLGPLLPTPVVNDMGEGKTPEDWDAWTGRMQEKHGNGNGHGPSLSIEAQRLPLLGTPRCADGMSHNLRTGVTNARGRLEDQVSMLPTPTTRDHKGANQRGDSSCLHGALTNPPSDVGSTSPDDQLPGQLSLELLSE